MLAVILLSCLVQSVMGKRYEAHERINIVANTVGPFNNPTETYSGTGKQVRHSQNLGETLSGSHKVTTPYELTFLDPVPWRALCEDYLVADNLKQLKDAVEDDYFFEFFVDELPLWGYVGEVAHEEFIIGKQMQGARVYLYPHLVFSLGFNGDQIVSANVTTDVNRRIDITDVADGQEVTFSYSVVWIHQPHIQYSNRMSRYADSTFLPGSFEIHWLAIVNSAVLVFFLTIFLAVILMRILKNDFSRYINVDEEDLTEDDSGWKMVHGDVFRAPAMMSLFTSVIGAGAQLFAAAFVLLICVLTGSFRATKRGALLTAAIIVFALCGIVGGMVSGRLFKQLKGTNWAWTAVTTASVFTVPVALVFFVVNSIAWSNNSTAALPTTTITLIAGIVLFVHFPLTVVGAVVGKNLTAEYRPPCRTNKVPREVPKVMDWYKQPWAQLLGAGFLPFSAVYIELHYIFAAMWGHKIYTLFGILFMAFIMLTLVASCITVTLVYFQLAREDHRWWWQSTFNGGATGLFIFLYSFFYWYQRSNMDGVLQLSFFFGYSGLVAYGFSLMLGFVGFISSFTFVEYIYGNVKTD